MAAPQASSRLEMLQARFQQKQLQEKEQKLLQLYDQQQQRAYQVVQRGSAGSNSSHHGPTTVRSTTTTTTTHTTSTSQGGKVRQMFDERRQTTVKGIDRSYPLEPLENKLRKQTNTNGVTTQRNGNVTVNRQSMKRTSRADVNSNVNGGKPVVSYHEEIIHDSFGPTVRRHNDEDEYVENRIANGHHYRHEIDNEHEETLKQDMMEHNRMMAKIHLMGFDETLKHRVKNDLESEEFPEYLMVDVPDKLSKRNATKKLSQAEERLERFKNANAKRNNVSKQSTSTVLKKRSEQTIPTKSNCRRRSEVVESSSTSARSESSRTSRRSQRILENIKSLLSTKTRVVDKIGRKETSETFSRRTSPQSFSTRETIKEKAASKFYPRSNEFKSLTSDGKIFVRHSPSPRFFCRESDRSATTVSIDRKSGSPPFSSSYEEKIFKKRSTSPQFFCRESERSATTMSIDRTTSASGSPSYDREITNASPRFSLGESGQSRRTSESKSSIWSDRGISSRQSASPQYRESRRSETAMSTDRETVESKSSDLSKRNTISQFSYSEPEQMSIYRKINEPKSLSYDRKMLTKRSATPRFLNGKIKQQSATFKNIDRKYNGFKSLGITRGKRSTSPQFFCKEGEKSATTMLIEPRLKTPDSTRSILKQRNYTSNISRKQSETDKEISFTKHKRTPSPSVTGHEVKKTSNKNEVNNITETRRSSKISETSATSASSIVNLKYGLEFDNIFQSAGLVRKFMKSQYGTQNQSPSKRKVTDTRTSARGNQSKNRKISPVLQTRRSTEDGRRATPEFTRKTITPTEVDMDVQEITMTDHRIERDKLQKRSSPISKRQFDGTYTKSLGSKAKLKTSITYPVRKTHKRRETILEPSVFKKNFSGRNASPQSSDKVRTCFGENKIDSLKITSPEFFRKKKYSTRTSPILFDSENRAEEIYTKFDQSRILQSSRLIQEKNSSTNDKYNQERREDKNKDTAVNEVDAKIGVKYQTVVETALNKEIEDYRKIARPSSADRIANKKVFLRETTQKPTKSSTSKKTISSTRECGKRHDIKSKVSPLRKTAEISRDTHTPKISSSRNITADQTSKFSKFSNVQDRKREDALVVKKSTETYDEMSVKRKIEEPKDNVKVICEDKYGKDLKRIDSVESALRRFDSIDTESERSSPTSFQKRSEISLQAMDIQTKTSVKESIASKYTTVSPREITNRISSKSMLKSPVARNLKVKNATRKSDLENFQSKTHFCKRLMTFENTESKQRSTKIRSPACRRRLFDTASEREKLLKSSCAKIRKDENRPFVNFRNRKDKTISNVKSFEDLNRDVTGKSTSSGETSTFSVKPLRSIEDIRKSIDNVQNKLIATEESRSVIAKLRSRESVDTRKSSSATNAAKNVFLDPTNLVKIESRICRITKSPSPDSNMTKQRETNTKTTRGSVPPSPTKSPETALRTKPSKKSTIAKGADTTGNKIGASFDTTDGVVLQNGSSNESTKKPDAFTIDFDGPLKEDDAMPLKKSPIKKSNEKQQMASSASGRPSSSNSVNLIQDSGAKNKMAESERGKGKGVGKIKVKSIEKPSSSSSKLANTSSFNEDITTDTKGLVKCKTCGRNFAQNRIDLHEEICKKTAAKKRKQFDPMLSRIKGTELEPFVKKSLAKRETKMKKPETKSDWRRKHEEFINAIRYARETQARLAAGGNLSDLPPPPPSDTSDYIQCEYCSRKFNRSAAERHVPICKRMHDKKQAPKAKR